MILPENYTWICLGPILCVSLCPPPRSLCTDRRDQNQHKRNDLSNECCHNSVDSRIILITAVAVTCVMKHSQTVQITHVWLKVFKISVLFTKRENLGDLILFLGYYNSIVWFQVSKRRKVYRKLHQRDKTRRRDILLPRWLQIRRVLVKRRPPWPWKIHLPERGHLRGGMGRQPAPRTRRVQLCGHRV